MANKGIVAYLSKLDDKAMAELMAQVATAKKNQVKAPVVTSPAKPKVKSVSPYASSIGKVIVYCYSGRVVTHKFYRVLGVTNSRAKLQELPKKSLEGGSMWHMPVVPVMDDVNGQIITKAIKEDGTISMGKYEGITNIKSFYDPDKEYADNLMD